MPVIILDGIYGGIFTPTEAAAVSVFYGLIVGIFVYKEIDSKKAIDILTDSCSTTATVMFITMGAPLFAPVALELGIDPIHLGVVMIVNLAIGLFTPPVGVNLYVACRHREHQDRGDQQGNYPLPGGVAGGPASGDLHSRYFAPVRRSVIRMPGPGDLPRARRGNW